MNNRNVIPLSDRIASPRSRSRQVDADQENVISIDRISYRIARSRMDYAGAFSLLQRRYVETGLATDVTATLRVMPYHLWHETQVFIAEQRGEVIATVSLTRDGDRKGIPMDSNFAGITSRLRAEQQTFGEVCALTVTPERSRSSGEIFGQLTRLMTFFSRRIGLDVLVAIVHPRHAKFYRRAMGFEPIGDIEEIQQVCGQPGLPILCRINERSRFHPRWRNFYFEGNFSDSELDPHRLSHSDSSYFQEFLPSVEKTLIHRRTA
ncbi:hypothetical protein Mal15_37380 [Stieleria maiorica]|uniref:N-acyl amino acid synthase FeeM catalytic core domain-containing protein n=1 Tax=Stieleria maiorica TaxID=2795974 RepID=A0A5B9MEI4_9BACT|nr:hypothetical protein [Stieleria maiorica]QEF99672.1 hypothetical protein Mal15_37380 [Stieleria maiorica]